MEEGEEQKLEKLIHELHKSKNNNVSSEVVRQFLSLCRSTKNRQSHLVVQFAPKVFPKLSGEESSYPSSHYLYRHKLTIYHIIVEWNVAEQLIIAYLELAKIDEATTLLKQLQKQFSKSSSRIMQLEGMILEANQQFDLALQTYAQLNEHDTISSLFALKRCFSFPSFLSFFHSFININ